MPAALRTISLQVLIAAALLLGCVALRIADPEPVARVRASVFDSYLRSAPRAADPAFPVRVVAIDEASLARVGQWPWPRTKLAELVTKITAAGARTIAFDVLLVEPDRMSPGELARALSDQQNMQSLVAEIAKLPSNDDTLAKAIAAAPVVLGIAGDARGAVEIGEARASLVLAGDDPSRFVHAFAGGVSNLPVLRDAASGIGAVNWLPAQDQVVRRAPLLASIAGHLYPSLALETLRVGAGQSTILVKSSGASGLAAFGQQTGVESIRVGETILAVDGRGEMWLRYAASDPRRTTSAYTILDGAFDAGDIRGRHIFIGATAAGLLDIRATPLDPSVPGVEIHAQALEQMLSGDHLTRPAYATGAEIAFLVLAGALVTWLIARSGAVIAAAVAVGAIAAVTAASWLAYARGGLLFDPVYPALSLSLLYLGTSLTTYVRSETDRAKIRSAFSHYVAPSLVAELVRNHDKLKLGGETRVVTLLFADVRGFSRISEGLDAEGLVRFVNRLFTPLTETILHNRGTIDKFMGDAVMAFWNAPADDADHARNACRAALAMLGDLTRLNDELSAEAQSGGQVSAPVRMGIGLNTGACVVGNVGSPERFDYSVLGDVVNVAARFEDATKAFGCDIIIGETTATAAADFAHLEIGTVTPRGKDRPERIYALFGDETMAADADFKTLTQVHAKLLTATQTGDAALALAALAECRKLAPPTATALYRALALQFDLKRQPSSEKRA